MGNITDYKQKYLDSFFKWQESYHKASEENQRLKHELEIKDAYIKELENKLKELQK